MNFAFKTQFSRFSLGFAGAALAAFMALPALATTYSNFTFTGNCEDCAEKAQSDSFEVKGFLTLTNYKFGSNIDGSTLFTFKYGGSNLINGFTLSSDTMKAFASDQFESGNQFMLNFAAAATVQTEVGTLKPLIDSDLYFRTTEDGLFEIGTGSNVSCTSVGTDSPCETIRDFGTGSWAFTGTVTDPATEIPEPDSLLLLGAALVGLAATRRRKALA